ncbi:cytochrome c oxidase subunit VI [Perkinsela sp. CCAP 1560/4]|nr:cytochrome c oxidase subunit VI [Perkinsela sp. CCAP 1560/4]KNH04174.1 cytochrome c oxidase subunit VI [Perkinsela sp. CCAP 1560/4]|eukprot:KNH03611.1 cytochrome c oxidase subunit VI [Perkinsela sp. CCAP 1560/4]
MVHPDYHKYRRPERTFHLPHFTDFQDPRFAHAMGCGKIGMQGWLLYHQWLHCVGNWGEDHSMCKKARWYCEKLVHEETMEVYDKKKQLGFYDRTILYGQKPFHGFVPSYQPVKKNRPGAYEWWLSRDFENLGEEDANMWREKAPILHDILIKGKKPIYDSKSTEEADEPDAEVDDGDEE